MHLSVFMCIALTHQNRDLGRRLRLHIRPTVDPHAVNHHFPHGVFTMFLIFRVLLLV